MRFLGYIVSHQGIQIEEKQIKFVRNWPEPQSVCDIQIFLGFANFYQRFIQGLSRFTAPLTSMLKTTLAVGPAASAEIRDEEQDGKGIRVDGDEKEPTQPAQKSCKGQSKGQKTAKSKKWIQAEKSEASRAKNFSSQSGSFLISKAKKAFTKMRQAFVEAPILNHFDPEHYI